MAERNIWYDARNETKMEALPSRYHGLMAKEMTAQMKKPVRIVMYFGSSAARSFPAGSEFSKIEEKMAQ